MKVSFVRSLMILCLLILLFPVIMGSAVYLYVSRQFSDMIIVNNRAALAQTKNAVEDRLLSMERIVRELSTNTELPYLALDRLSEGDQFYRVWNFRNDLSRCINDNLFIRDLYVFFNNSDVVVSSKTSYSKASFYDRFFSFDDLARDSFLSLMAETHYDEACIVANAGISTELEQYNALAYIKTIPVSSAQKYAASVLILIDEEKLRALLDSVAIGENGYTYILDNQNQVMISRLGPLADPVYIDEFTGDTVISQQVNGTDLTFVPIESTATQWRFVAALPTRQLLAQAEKIRTLTITISLCSLLIGLGFAYVFLKRRMQPLNIAMNKLSFIYRDKRPVKYPFKFVGEQVQFLAEDNQRLQFKLSSDRQLLRQVYISAVLRGDASGSSEMPESLEIIGNWYNVSVIRVVPPDAWEQSQSILSEYRDKLFNGSLHFIHHEKNIFYALFCHRGVTPQECRSEADGCLQRIQAIIKHDLNAQISVYCGRICSSLAEAPLSWGDACGLSSENALTDQIIWHNGADEKCCAYFYSIDTEMYLIEQIRAGHADAVSVLLDKIYRDNFSFSRLSLDMKRRLFDELQGTLLKVSGDTKYCTLPYAQDYDELFSVIRDEILNICASFQARLNQGGDTGTRMLQYINDHYSDNSLSLKRLSEVFALNESYVSKYFKSCTGVNFFSYLEGLRIQHAQRLLDESAGKIKDIALKVGYLDDKSFRRAYKKRVGDTPRSINREII